MLGFKVFKWVVAVAVLIAAAWYLRQTPWVNMLVPAHEVGQQWGEVNRGDVVQRVTISGMIIPRSQLMVWPPFAGYIRKIYVNVGQRVKKGQSLISFSQTADLDLEDVFPIRASTTGIVTQIMRSEGEYVTELQDVSNVVLRVDDTRTFYLECDVSETDVLKLKIGQKAKVRVSAILDQSFSGYVDSIALASTHQDRWNRGVVQFRTRVVIDDEEVSSVRPGMTATADIIADERKSVLRLAHEFIERDRDGYFVQTDDGVKQAIKVGLRDESHFEIIEGVALGQKVRQVDFLSTSPKGLGG